MKLTPSASHNPRKSTSSAFPVRKNPFPQISGENPSWLENIPGGFLITDASGIIQSANQEACDIFQISPDKIAGQQITRFIEPTERPYLEEKMHNSLEISHSNRISARLIQEDHPGQTIAIFVKSAQGSQEGSSFLYWTIHTDFPDLDTLQAERERADQAEASAHFRNTLLLNAINGQRGALSALKTTTENFRTIFGQGDLAIQLLDIHGAIIESNPAFGKMMGYDLEELVGKRITDIIHIDDLEEIQKIFRLLKAGKVDTYKSQVRLIHQNGGTVWSRMFFSLLNQDTDQPQYLICILENITPQIQMEMELSEVQQRLIDSREAERLRLAQDLHDGPVQDLYGISYQLSSLWSNFGNPESYPQIRTIEEELEGVIQSLRQVCGELRPPSLAPFGLEKAIFSHAQGIQEKSPEINISLDLMSDRKALPENVRLALFRIYQIAIANVIRHAEAKNILIHFSFDQDQIVLTIQDDGKGFQVPKRWVELVRKGHFGLVGAIERAQSIGGELSIVSRPGEGTTLRVIVPRQIEQPAKQGDKFFLFGI